MDKREMFKYGHLQRKNSQHFRQIRNIERKEQRGNHFAVARQGLVEENDDTAAAAELEEPIVNNSNKIENDPLQSKLSTIVLKTKNQEKLTKQEEYLKRFIEYRDKKQKEKRKNGKENTEPNDDGRGRRRSVFVAVPTPPRKPSENVNKPFVANNLPKINTGGNAEKKVLIIRPTKTSTLRMNAAKNTSAFAPTAGVITPVAGVIASTSGAIPKVKTTMAPPKAIKKSTSKEKPRLAVAMKAKNRLPKVSQESLKKIACLTAQNFMTSTAKKSTVPSRPEPSVSPIRPFKNENSKKVTSEKENLLTPTLDPKRTYRFLKRKKSLCFTPPIESDAGKNPVRNSLVPKQSSDKTPAKSLEGSTQPPKEPDPKVSIKKEDAIPILHDSTRRFRFLKKKDSLHFTPPVDMNPVGNTTVTKQSSDKMPTDPEKGSGDDNEEAEKGLTAKTSDEGLPYIYVSPHVKISRGKVSLEQERSKRNSFYLENTLATPLKSHHSSNQMKTKKNISKLIEDQLTPEAREALVAVVHFRNQLDAEIKRLTNLCDEWQQCKETNLAQVQAGGCDDMIDAAVGQTKLLMNRKLMQFKGLVDRCEAGARGTGTPDDGSEDTKPISPIDLEGFWSMVYLQVENVDKRFKNLEKWKANNWQDPDAIAVQEKPKLNKIKKPSAPKAPPRRANNALKEMMRKKAAELRQQQQQQESEKANPCGSDEATPKTKSKRRSSNTGTPVCVVVRDRKSLSRTPTILRYASPQTAGIATRRSTARKLKLSTPPASTFLQTTDMRKSILKTPGTERKGRKSVIFNENLSVKKCRFINYNKPGDDDNSDPDDSFDRVQQIEMSQLGKLKESLANAAKESPDAINDFPNYRLRNRKVLLRPSEEIIIPVKKQ